MLHTQYVQYDVQLRTRMGKILLRKNISRLQKTFQYISTNTCYYLHLKDTTFNDMRLAKMGEIFEKTKLAHSTQLLGMDMCYKKPFLCHCWVLLLCYYPKKIHSMMVGTSL